MKFLSRLFLLITATASLPSLAALGEHPIILIHGFQAGQLQTKPDHDAVIANGKIENQPQAVTNFMPYHYPLLMGDDYSHSGLIGTKHQGKVTAVSQEKTLLDGTIIKVSTTDSTYWLSGNTYRYVDNSKNETMSELVSDLL